MWFFGFGKESYDVRCERCKEELTINRDEVEAGKYGCPACGHVNPIPARVRTEYKTKRGKEIKRKEVRKQRHVSEESEKGGKAKPGVEGQGGGEQQLGKAEDREPASEGENGWQRVKGIALCCVGALVAAASMTLELEPAWLVYVGIGLGVIIYGWGEKVGGFGLGHNSA